MKKLLIGLVILAILLVGGWYGAESWLSRQAQAALAGQPEIAARITPMRQPGRLGLHAEDVNIASPEGTASLPAIDGYVSLGAPATLRLDLPGEIVVTPANGAPTTVTMTQGQAQVTLSPLRDLAIRHAAISTQALSVDGMPVLDNLDLTAELTHMGAAAPAGSAAAYDLDLSGTGVDLVVMPDRLGFGGRVQVWLDAIPGPDLAAGGVPPNLTGMQTRGVTVTLGDDLTARLAGRIEADAEGFAKGEAAIYTSDGPAFIDKAMAAGLLPPDIAEPLRALVAHSAGTPPAPASDDGSQVTAESVVDAANARAMAEEIVTLPPAEPGEIRLPIFMHDGLMRLGPIPLGPAPRIAGF